MVRVSGGAMSAEAVFQTIFAAAAVATVAALAAAAFARPPRRLFVSLAAVCGAAAAAAWAALAVEPSGGLAVAAAGLSACAAFQVGALQLRDAVARQARLDADLERAEVRLREFVERESADRAAELERTLARARAESISLLAEEERRLAEER